MNRSPKIITRAEIVAEVPANWRRAHFRAGKWVDGDDKRVTAERLDALAPPTKADVDAIIGSASWTQCICDHCGSDTDAVAQMGDEPDYDSRTAAVCITCLRLAVACLEGTVTP